MGVVQGSNHPTLHPHFGVSMVPFRHCKSMLNLVGFVFFLCVLLGQNWAVDPVSFV